MEISRENVLEAVNECKDSRWGGVKTGTLLVPPNTLNHPSESRLVTSHRLQPARLFWPWDFPSESRLVMSHRLQPARLFWPLDFPCKNPGVGCHFLLQGFFLIQGLNLSLLLWRQILYHLSHKKAPSHWKFMQKTTLTWRQGKKTGHWEMNSPGR